MLQRLYTSLAAARPIERVAAVGVLLTPLTLLLDYRLGLPLRAETIQYRPIGEAAGRVVEYEQVLGTTQGLWIGLGLVTLLGSALRAGFRSVTTVSLGLLTAVVITTTLYVQQPDDYTALALSSTLLPLIAIAAVLSHPELRVEAVRWLAVGFAGFCALATAATLAENAIAGQLTERFDLYLFGATTESALVLAALVILSATVAPSPRLGAALVAPLGAGLVFTETRGALAALTAGALAVGFMKPRWRSRALVALPLAVGLFVVVADRSLSVGSQGDRYRFENLAVHWNEFLERPFTGHGLSEASAPAFQAAHNTLLGLANAGGIAAAVLFLVAWFWPVRVAVLLNPNSFGTAAAVGVAAATLVGWVTTGTEVLIYSPPTNLLPLLLTTGLACAAASEAVGAPSRRIHPAAAAAARASS